MAAENIKGFIRIKITDFNLNPRIQNKDQIDIEVLVEDYNDERHESLKQVKTYNLKTNDAFHSHVYSTRLVKIRFRDHVSKVIVASYETTPTALFRKIKDNSGLLNEKIELKPVGTVDLAIRFQAEQKRSDSSQVQQQQPEPEPEPQPPELPQPRNAHKKTVMIKERGHELKVKFFMEPTFCSVCDRFLWGLINQGLKCENCSLACHKTCFKGIKGTCTKTKGTCSSNTNRPHNFKRKQFYKLTYCNHCGKLIKGLYQQGHQCTQCSITVHPVCRDKASRSCGLTKDEEIYLYEKIKKQKEIDIEQQRLYSIYEDYRTGHYDYQDHQDYLKPISNQSVKIDDFEIISNIGNGAFGKVFKVQHKIKGKICAMKAYKKYTALIQNDLSYIELELKVLKLSKDCNFLTQFLCSIHDEDHIYIFMELMEGGDLYNYVVEQTRKYSRGFDVDFVRFYAAQIYLALEFLHINSIVYRDLKPENVIIDINGHSKVTDFGISKENVNFTDKRATTNCGTSEYMSPEVLKETPYTCSTDYWSFGCLVFELFRGVTPFYKNDLEEMNEKIQNHNSSKSNELFIQTPYLDHASKIFISQLLDNDPKTRLGNPNSPHGKIRDSLFFKPINWSLFEQRKYDAPLKGKLLPSREPHRLSTSQNRLSKTASGELMILSTLDPHTFDNFYYVHPDYWH